MFAVFDIVGIIVFLLIAGFIYKKAWFYSFYEFVKFLMVAVLSVVAGNFIAARIPFTLPLTALQQSLIIYAVIFIILWKLLSIKRVFFAVSTRTLDLNRFFFVFGINKILAIFPALIVAGFTSFLLFNFVSSVSSKYPDLQFAIEQSQIIKPLSYKVYFAPIAYQKFKLFDGVAFKLGPSANYFSGETTYTAPYTAPVENNTFTPPPSQPIPTALPSTPSNPTPTSYFIILRPQRTQAPTVVPPTPTSAPIIQTFPTQIPQAPIGASPFPTQAPIIEVPVPTVPPPPPPAPTNISQVEQDILRLTNDQRSANGLAPFVWDEALAAVARAHSADMEARNFLSHISPDGTDPFQRMRAAGIAFTTAAENIAGGATADIMVTNWMNSPGHRANILNPAYGKLGVGVAPSSKYGLTGTQAFTN